MFPRKKDEIKAIIFDVGGVLALGKNNLSSTQKFARTKGVHEYVAKKLKISLDQWFDSIDSNYSGAIEGKISGEKAIEIISSGVKISKENLKKIIKKAYRNHFKQNKQLFELVFNLKRMGYKIAVLSDQWMVSREAIMPEKLYDGFDEVIISYEVGFRKPNPKIYKLILKRLKLSARNCVFIDDQSWNLKPAKKLGMKTILFKNNKQLFNHPNWKRLWELK